MLAGVRVLRCGDHAVLVEVDGPAQVVALSAALRAVPPAGVVEVVPAARTLLLRYDPARTSYAALTAAVSRAGHSPEGAAAGPTPAPPAAVVEVPVRYDGEDLAEVAELTGIDPDEVVRRHTAAEYTCAFCGFAPGFAYLTGLDPVLRVPRRASPRQAVPAGAVAVAGEFAAVYPRSSPGGWRILGATDLAVWDLDRTSPALIVPGARVRFVAVP
jgi:KipI family sensor histidine kinase inhibitor